MIFRMIAEYSLPVGEEGRRDRLALVGGQRPAFPGDSDMSRRAREPGSDGVRCDRCPKNPPREFKNTYKIPEPGNSVPRRIIYVCKRAIISHFKNVSSGLSFSRAVICLFTSPWDFSKYFYRKKFPFKFVYSDEYWMVDLGKHVFPVKKYRLIYEELLSPWAPERKFSLSLTGVR